MLAVFTDLDNCLLDHHTYEFEPALPALEALRRRGAAVVVATSKTRAEVEWWHRRLGLSHPSVVENGGAVVLAGAPPVVLGQDRSSVLAALREAAQETGALWRGFSMMPIEEIAERCGMPLERARLASARQYSEPFVLVTPGRAGALRDALHARGMRLVRGGRFWHALAHNGKEAGVDWLLKSWRAAGEQVASIGIGDAPNDDGFLALVDHPIKLADATTGTGPDAWRREIERTLQLIRA